MKLSGAGDKGHLGKLPNKQGLGNTLKRSVNDTNDDYQVGTAWTFRGKKGLHCFPGEVTGHGELSEVDSGQGGTARVHRQRVGHGCGIIQQQTAAPERNVQGVLALVGSCEMLVAGMPPKRQSSCNACVPSRPYCDTL